MKAIQYHDYGGPEVLVLEEITRPEPGVGQVLIRVMAAGVNPADWKIRSGVYRAFAPVTFPGRPGLDGAGVIEAVGENVTEFQPGDEVYGVLTGAYAEYALASAGYVQPKPANLSFEEAAAVPVGALTAWTAVETANIQAGQRILVHGAAGGVGLYVVQLARAKGAHITATGSAKNLEYIRSLGVETALDYNAAPFETLVSGLDAVIDTVGGELAERSFKVVRPGGIYITVAGRLAPDAGEAEGIRTISVGRAAPAHLAELSALLASKELIPVVGTVFPLAEASAAQALSATGHGRGRIVLKIS